MPMSPFLQRFPELGRQETRSVRITGRNDLPNGEYGLIELYCDEPHCDCRRVTIAVLRPHTGWKFWATISYGWESLAFYQKWSKSPEPLDPSEWKGPYLDPLCQQTQYSPALLNLFHIVLGSPGYVERLKRHYRLFRTAVEKESRGNSRERSRGKLNGRECHEATASGMIS
jgi:hypothetical protein